MTVCGAKPMRRGQRNRRAWTAADSSELVRLHAAGATIHDIAATMQRGKRTISERASLHGLHFTRSRPWTQAEFDRVRRDYADMRAADVAVSLDRPISQIYDVAKRLDAHKSAAFLASDRSGRIRRGKHHPGMIATQFKPGHVPANKGIKGWCPGGRCAETQFKRGVRQGRAVNLYKPIGTERISKEGYLERKINDDLPMQSRWRAVHLVVWEAANGPLPARHCVTFRDGDKTNVAIGNLQCIPRAQNMRRNSVNRYPEPIRQLIRTRGLLIKKINRLSK